MEEEAIVDLSILSTYEFGINSDELQVPLHGRISMIIHDQPHYEKGTILLTNVDDPSQSLMCQMDRHLPDMQDNEVFIKEWNYIRQGAYHYLEFLLDSVHRDEHSILVQTILNDKRLFSLNAVKKRLFYIEQDPEHEVEHVAGQVGSISILYAQPGIVSTFFVQLTSDMTLVFSGDEMIKWYRYFVIGCYYTFQDVVETQVPNGVDQQVSVYQVQPHSQCRMISKEQFEHKLITSIEPRPYELPQIYTGKITRVVDSLFGIYELDHQFTFCVYHSLAYSPDRPYRVNTRLAISNFHMTDLQQTNLDWLPSVIVACTKTCIEIVTFPLDHDAVENEEEDENKYLFYMDTLQQRSTFAQLVQQLTLYSSLKTRFQQDLQGVFRALCQSMYRCPRPQGSFINDFFHHTQACSVMGAELPSYNPLVYPSLQQIKEQLKQKLVPHQVELAGGNYAFEQNNVDVKVASFDSDYVLLGKVDTLQDGRLCIMDDTAHILITTPAQLRLDNVYMVRRAQYFVEDLSYFDFSASTRVELQVAYLACEAEDLVCCSTPHQPVFCMPPTVDDAKIAGIHLQDPTLVVIHVLNIEPIKCIARKDSIHLTSVLIGNKFTLKDNIPTRDYVRLSLSNKVKDSLKLYPRFQVNQWYVIRDWQEDDTVLDPSKHTIWPIAQTSTPLPEMTPLRLILTTEAPKLPPPSLTIHPVSEFIVSRDTSFSTDKSANYYFTYPLHVRGIIISKKLIDGYNTFSAIDHVSPLTLFEHGIGTGIKDRKLQIELRQVDSLDTMMIYMDLNKSQYPLGLVAGATVVFRNLFRKTKYMKNYAFYGVAGDATRCYFESGRVPPCATQYEDQVQQKRLGWFQEQKMLNNVVPEDRLFKVCCQVSSVITLSIKLECKDCHCLVRYGDCEYLCKDASRVLKASAFIELSDSMGTINASVDGQRLIFQMLRLSPNQQEALYKAASKLGELRYAAYDRVVDAPSDVLPGYTMDDLCRRSKETGRMWFYGRVETPSKKYKPVADDEQEVAGLDVAQQLGLRVVTISEHGTIMKSMEFGKPKLKIVEIQPADPFLLAQQLSFSSSSVINL